MYDWCYTNEGCGEHSAIYGWWDKCLYLDSSKPDYVALDWKSKQDQLWADITADNSIDGYPSPAITFAESMLTVFDDEWDVMPAGREKGIHGVGAVFPFVVNIADSPYTGLFKTGETRGLMRLGSANDFTALIGGGMTPGAGIKFLRSGRSSANFVALNQLGPIEGGNYNFFAVPLTNQLPDDIPLPLVPLGVKFCQAQSCPVKVGLSDICKYDQEGNEAEEIVFPFKVTFDIADVHFPEEMPESVQAFAKLFQDISPGTAIYTLKAHANPDDTEGHVLGQVVTTDTCTSSKFGDHHLFFKHQYIQEDKDLRPDWAAAYDAHCTDLC